MRVQWRNLPIVKAFARPRTNPRVGEIVHVGGSGIAGRFSDSGVEKRPSAISYTDMEDMLADPQIAFGLAVAKMPILGVNWRISCENETNGQFVEDALGEIWQPFIRETMTALDFGVSIQEKRWKRDHARWVWKTFLPVHPKNVTILRSGNNFNGFRQGSRENPPVPADKAFIYSHNPPFGNLYGRPRTWASYNPWWIAKHIKRFASVYFEKSAQPLREGRAPARAEKITDGGSVEVDGMSFMMDEVLKKIIAGATDYVLSSDRDEYGNYIWDVIQKELRKSGIDYVDYMRYLDVMKSRGIFVPDLTVFQNVTTGSRAMSEAHGTMFWEMEMGQLRDVKGYINLYILPQIVAYNFGVDAPPCSWEFEPLAPDKIEWLKQLVDRMVQRGTARPDLEEVQERLGIGIEAVNAPTPAPGKTEEGNEENPEREEEETRREMDRRSAYLAESHLW